MKILRWIDQLLGIASALVGRGVPSPGPDVPPITDADRGRPPRLGPDEKTPAETPAAKRRH